MTRDDRILPWVRWTLAGLAVLSSIFGPILFLLSDRTADLFTWTIEPQMSAVFVGAGYVFGAIAIWHQLWNGRWRALYVALAGVWAFSTAMLGATLLHLDRFHHGTILFYGWFLVYVFTPILLPIAYLLNRGTDPGVQPNEYLVPRLIRLVLLLVGLAYAVAGLTFFLAPTAVADVWPWRLTPLVARVMGGWLLLFGLGAGLAWIEPRWSAYRLLTLDAIAWLVLLLVGSLLHTADFDFGRPLAVPWFVGLAAAIAGTVGYYWWNERASRATATAAGS